LFDLGPPQIETLERMGEKSAHKLHAAIEAAKNTHAAAFSVCPRHT